MYGPRKGGAALIVNAYLLDVSPERMFVEDRFNKGPHRQAAIHWNACLLYIKEIWAAASNDRGSRGNSWAHTLACLSWVYQGDLGRASKRSSKLLGASWVLLGVTSGVFKVVCAVIRLPLPVRNRPVEAFGPKCNPCTSSGYFPFLYRKQCEGWVHSNLLCYAGTLRTQLSHIRREGSRSASLVEHVAFCLDHLAHPPVHVGHRLAHRRRW